MTILHLLPTCWYFFIYFVFFFFFPTFSLRLLSNVHAINGQRHAMLMITLDFFMYLVICLRGICESDLYQFFIIHAVTSNHCIIIQVCLHLQIES